MWVLQGQRKCRPVFGIVHAGHYDVRSDVIAKGHGIHRYSFPLQPKGTVDLGQGIDHLVLSKVMWGEQLPTDVHGFDDIPVKCPDVQSGMSRLAKGMIQPRQPCEHEGAISTYPYQRHRDRVCGGEEIIGGDMYLIFHRVVLWSCCSQ